MQKLVRFQPRFDGVLGDVFLKRLQLDLIAHDVVVAVFLPEITAAIEPQIDLASGVALAAMSSNS